jgi:acetyl esterase/lipase
MVLPKYRLAPENKQPAGQIDFMHAFLHFHANAAKYGIDSNRMAIAGESGVGILCCGAARQLIMRGEIGKVRAVFLHEPQLSAHFFEAKKEETTPYEQGFDSMMSFEWAWGAHCHDFEKQKAEWDPNVFPGRMPEE